MVVCPLIIVGGLASPDGYKESDTECMGEDCGFYSPRVGRCAIGVIGDMADRVNSKF